LSDSIITLDAQKTFDRLNHELLFNRLYHDGICGDLWILLRNMYREVSVKIKWDNNLSRKVDVAQGSKFVAFLVSGTISVFVGFILTRSLSVKISAISSRAWASTIRSKLMREYE
jgi:hypothetical protein